MATVSVRIGRRVQIVGEPPGAGALHQRAAQAGQASAEQRTQLVHRRLVLFLAPRPVAVQVHVVVSQALLGGQARAQAPVRGLGDAGLLEPERREELAQPLDLIVVRARHMLEPAARARIRARHPRGSRASPRLRTPGAA